MNRDTHLPDMFAPPQPPERETVFGGGNDAQNVLRDTILGVSQSEKVVLSSDYSPVDGVVTERYQAPVESFTPGANIHGIGPDTDESQVPQGVGVPGYGYETKPVRRSCI